MRFPWISDVWNKRTVAHRRETVEKPVDAARTAAQTVARFLRLEVWTALRCWGRTD